MTYVIEKLDVSAKEKILTDSACNAELTRRLKHFIVGQKRPVNWAIDRQKNSYLFKLPSIVREDSGRRSYLFNLEGLPYVFYLEGIFGAVAYFEDFCKPEPRVLEAVQAEIAEAFSVYGEFGEGPLNKDGVPEFSITPLFS